MSEIKFNFHKLFVFDLANNHQGDVQHALKIIMAMGAIARKHNVRAIFKFQFRQLETFIHPKHKADSQNKHIPRFLSTHLDHSDFRILLDAVRNEKMLSMCTPFDESSVNVISEMGFDLIKVASCSAKDWPLLEKIASANKPVIFSTGGLQLSNIDDLVSFFDHRGVDFAIMHCVSIYPTPAANCNLNQIDVLQQRYPSRVIGWSTHECPDEMLPVQIAVAKGAQIFERHVGINTNTIKLNAYSSTPDQIDRWIESYKLAITLCGNTERTLNPLELESLDSLKRGIFARRNVKKGEVITIDDIYFAMPYIPGQVDSGAWRKGIIVDADIAMDDPVMFVDVKIPLNSDAQIIKAAVHEVKALLNEARISLNSDFEVEYSHHYGISRFREYGAVLISCINREYCKKIIVQLPGQKHPAHFHKLKEETFQVLYGELNVNVDGKQRKLTAGDIHLVMPGVWHSFSTDKGCVFEEVSTTHYNEDSVYRDSSINALKRQERKTRVDHWGRFQLPDKLISQE